MEPQILIFKYRNPHNVFTAAVSSSAAAPATQIQGPDSSEDLARANDKIKDLQGKLEVALLKATQAATATSPSPAPSPPPAAAASGKGSGKGTEAELQKALQEKAAAEKAKLKAIEAKEKAEADFKAREAQLEEELKEKMATVTAELQEQKKFLDDLKAGSGVVLKELNKSTKNAGQGGPGWDADVLAEVGSDGKTVSRELVSL